MSETITLVSCKDRRQALSIYRWKGKVEQAREVLLVIKSRRALAARLIDRVRTLHSYDVPEVVTVPILSGNPAYLRWVRQSTR